MQRKPIPHHRSLPWFLRGAVAAVALSHLGCSSDDDAPGGGSPVDCRITWSGAESGEVECSQAGLCNTGSFYLTTAGPSGNAIKHLQLTYDAAGALTVGTHQAAGLEAGNLIVQTHDPAVSYGPQLDGNGVLVGGTSLTLQLTAVTPSTDASNVCAGKVHGSLDAVLRERDNNANFGAETLTVHADF